VFIISILKLLMLSSSITSSSNKFQKLTTSWRKKLFCLKLISQSLHWKLHHSYRKGQQSHWKSPHRIVSEDICGLEVRVSI